MGKMHWWDLLRARSAFWRLIRDIGEDITLTLVDVGSVGGLKDRWRLLEGRVRSYCFDPREDALPREESGSTVLPFAVGRAQGTADFYRTRFGNMSSMLRPNMDTLHRFQDREIKAEVVSVEKLAIRSLDDVVPESAIDALKVDAQGGELEVLLGAQKLLDSGLLLAEVEVSFIERYMAQPLFGDVVTFMRSHDFELIDLYRLRRYFRTNRRVLRKYQIIPNSQSGQLSYADAIFFLSDAAFQSRLDRLAVASKSSFVVKAVLLLLIYGKFDRALQLFEEQQPLLSESSRRPLALFFDRLPLPQRRSVASRTKRLNR
jgi:FkbM family methyltransferase